MSARTAANTRAAALHRHHGPNDPRTLDARRHLAEVQIDDAIERALATAPPLSDDQVDRIAARLRGSA